ncbi:maleylpyruvate isomerase family mycothiol-dependent enzyme [Alloalcanivorax gelatiniphagus]
MAPDWLDLLRRRTRRFADVVDGADPATAVTWCPGWTLHDLVDHLGGVHQWAAHAVAVGDPGLEPEPAPHGTDLSRWYAAHASALVDVLAATPPDAAAWTLDKQDRTAGFWRRRQVHETVMHTWDAEEALGVPQPIEAWLAWDGVLEVAEILYPRQVHLGRVDPLPAALRLVATDVDGEVILGDGEPVVVEDSAEVLLRLLWHRAPTEGLAPRATALLAGRLAP